MSDETPTSLTGRSSAAWASRARAIVPTELLTLAAYLGLARLVSPHELGEFTAGSIAIGLGLLVGESGLLAALVQRRDHVEEAAATAFVASLASGFLLALACLATAPLVGLVFHSRTIGLVAAAMAGYILFRQALIVPDALMQRRFSFVRRVVLEPCSVVAFGAVAIATTALGLGVWGLVAGTYAGVVVQVTLGWTLVRWRPNLRLASFAMWRELARFGRHVVASEAVRVANSESRTVLIGRFLGPAALGQFGYAMRIAFAPVVIVVSAVSYVLMPAFSRISHEEERFRAAVLRSLRWLALLTMPSLVLLVLGKPLIVLLFGDRWTTAGRVAAAMCAVSVGSAIGSLASETWKAAGQPQWLLRMHALSLMLIVGLTAAMIPFGIVAVGAGFSVAWLVTAAFALWGIGRVVGVPVRRLGEELFAPALATGAATAALFGLERFVHAGTRSTALGLGLLALETLAAAVVYLAALRLISPTRFRELTGALAHARTRLRPRADPPVAPAPLP